MSRIFFDSWSGVLRVVVVDACAYLALVLLLRVSGKRTLAKLNAFDFVVTVALSSRLLGSVGVVVLETDGTLSFLFEPAVGETGS